MNKGWKALDTALNAAIATGLSVLFSYGNTSLSSDFGSYRPFAHRAELRKEIERVESDLERATMCERWYSSFNFDLKEGRVTSSWAQNNWRMSRPFGCPSYVSKDGADPLTFAQSWSRARSEVRNLHATRADLLALYIANDPRSPGHNLR